MVYPKAKLRKERITWLKGELRKPQYKHIAKQYTYYVTKGADMKRIPKGSKKKPLKSWIKVKL